MGPSKLSWPSPLGATTTVSTRPMFTQSTLLIPVSLPLPLEAEEEVPLRRQLPRKKKRRKKRWMHPQLTCSEEMMVEITKLCSIHELVGSISLLKHYSKTICC